MTFFFTDQSGVVVVSASHRLNLTSGDEAYETATLPKTTRIAGEFGAVGEPTRDPSHRKGLERSVVRRGRRSVVIDA